MQRRRRSAAHTGAGELPLLWRCHLSVTVVDMASPEAKFAPIGALRGGLALMVLGALMAWGPVDPIPDWLGLGTLSVGAVLVAIALGIRTLRT